MILGVGHVEHLGLPHQNAAAELHVVQDVYKRQALEWARIPHFYYNYYVYQYATGYAAAIALSRRILKEGEPAVEDYLKFLRGGSSLPPIELLKLAGVDMSTADPINQALALFDELIGELEELLTD